MRKGDTVFFVTKGVVRAGTLMSRKEGVALILYKKGSFQKYYRYKVCQIATEIEGGTNGGLSKSSDTASHKRCNAKNSKVSRLLESNKTGSRSGDKVFVGAWRIRNMA